MAFGRDSIETLIALFVGLIPLAFQFYRTGDLTSLAVTAMLLVMVPLYFIYDWLTTRFNVMETYEGRIR